VLAKDSFSNKRKFVIILLAVCLLSVLACFREWIRSGSDLIAGNIGDNRFIIAILEHWLNVFLGSASLASPVFFAPETGVLGYGESLFLFALPYMVFRIGLAAV
jgi:hypothetical protein